MGKKIAAIFDSTPHTYHGGGGITAYMCLRGLIDLGYEIKTFILSSSTTNAGKDEAFHLEHLKQLGANPEVLAGENPFTQPKNLIQRVLPRDHDLTRGLLLREKLWPKLKEFGPDVCFGYHWDALASLYQFKDCPKVIGLGDPLHLPIIFRRQFRKKYGQNSLRSLAIETLGQLTIRRAKSLMKKYLLDCHSAGAFAAHHAEEFRKQGISYCQYYRTPVPRPAKNWIEGHQRKEKFKIMHIGHLLGIATLTGVEKLAFEVLPLLRKLFPPNSFEIHLVGGFFETMPEHLKEALTCEEVLIRGQVSPADEEFISCDALLVPTPIELGIRVRIITALSFGTPVVTHVANTKGIPELSHKDNALIAQSGKELAEGLYTLYQDQDLQKEIGQKALSTYEALFSRESAAKYVAGRVEEAMGLRD